MLLFSGNVKKTSLYILILLCVQVYGSQESKNGINRDQYSTRANTLFDNVDDTQRQLDNEVRERLGRPKTVWVIHIPTRFPMLHSLGTDLPHTTTPNNLLLRIRRSKRSHKRADDKCEEPKCEPKPEEPKCEKKEPEEKCEKKEPEEKCEEKEPEEPKCEKKEPEEPKCEKKEPEEKCKKKEPEEKCEKKEPEEKCEKDDDSCDEIIPCPCDEEKPDEEKEGEKKCPNKTVEWNFKTQDKWHEHFKSCGGRSQSPVDLPVGGLMKARGARKLLFTNYNMVPENLTLINDGKSLTLYGHWKRQQWPLVYGGAAHSRRYLFHSMTLFWPSEHSIGGLHYPMETQVLHVSAEYSSFEEAVAATSDPQAFLGIVNIYKFSGATHCGTKHLLGAAVKCRSGTCKVPLKPASLSTFSPPFKDYVCYQGSLTTPPCTESVLWLVRRRSLPLCRDMSDIIQGLMGSADRAQNPTGRLPQPLNDRKIFLFL